MQSHLGLDICDPKHEWWLVPWAVGHAHPAGWSVCESLVGGRLLGASVRHKALYLMVRMARLLSDMWRARCKDIWSFPPGSYEAYHRDRLFPARPAIPRSAPTDAVRPPDSGDASQAPGRRRSGRTDVAPVLGVAREDGPAEYALVAEEAAFVEDAQAEPDGWYSLDGEEGREQRSTCSRPMANPMVCSTCQARHCCGTEDQCPPCDLLPEDEEPSEDDQCSPPAGLDEAEGGEEGDEESL